MNRPDRRTGLKGLQQAFDEARFGASRTLNLRESLPTRGRGDDAHRSWLRQQQVDRADEVLIITGRGNNSDDGVSVVREAVIRLLHALKRRGVVDGHEEHTPGSFVVTLAPVSALWESPKRNRGPRRRARRRERRRRSTSSMTRRGSCCAISPSARSRDWASRTPRRFCRAKC